MAALSAGIIVIVLVMCTVAFYRRRMWIATVIGLSLAILIALWGYWSLQDVRDSDTEGQGLGPTLPSLDGSPRT